MNRWGFSLLEILLSESAVRARLEAIRNNTFAGLYLDPGGRCLVLLDTDESRSFSPQDRVLQEVRLGEGEWTRVRIDLGEPALLLSDPRGIPQDFGGLSVNLTNRTQTYSRRIEMTPQGRVRTP
ncbi:MAG: GspH/FimT family protein [Thermaceae bacterium]